MERSALVGRRPAFALAASVLSLLGIACASQSTTTFIKTAWTPPSDGEAARVSWSARSCCLSKSAVELLLREDEELQALRSGSAHGVPDADLIAVICRVLESERLLCDDAGKPKSDGLTEVLNRVRGDHRGTLEVGSNGDVRGPSRFAAALGAGDRTSISVQLCEGPSLLAWVGAFRERPFLAREQRILGAIVPALQQRLRLERSAAEAPLLRAALESTMEILAAPAFLVDVRGGLRHANTAGRVLLESDRSTPATLSDAVRGGLPAAQLTPVVAPGLALHFLVLLAPPADETAHRVALARQRWSLTQRQVEVLALVAKGEANKTIAARLGCGVKTVEAHLTALLCKGESESRTGLLARLLGLRSP